MTTPYHHLCCLASIRKWRREITDGDATQALVLSSLRQNMAEMEKELTLELENSIKSGDITLESLLISLHSITSTT